MNKIKYNKETKSFSLTKVFSDWDQIRDLVKDQYPRFRFEKVRGSENDKSYKVKLSYPGGKDRILEIHKNPRRSALDNFQESTRMKVENPSKPKEIRKSIRVNQPYQHKGYTPEQMKLVREANDEDKYVRSSVAQNPNTPLEILDKLANDEYWDVRSEVAQNPNTPKEVLEKLANDKGEYVRSEVATNPNTPKEILEKLANDKSNWVRWNVAKNPNAPKELLEKII